MNIEKKIHSIMSKIFTKPDSGTKHRKKIDHLPSKFQCIHENPLYEKYFYPLCGQTCWCSKCHSNCTNAKCKPKISCGFCNNLMFGNDCLYNNIESQSFCDFCSKWLVITDKNFGMKTRLATQCKINAKAEKKPENMKKNLHEIKKNNLCTHDPKFFLEVKFDCCDSTFPCIECHNENTDHECIFSSHICGFCKKVLMPQELGKYKGCKNCSFASQKAKSRFFYGFYLYKSKMGNRYYPLRLIRRKRKDQDKQESKGSVKSLLVNKGIFWEGGNGCMDKRRMSRKCLHKYRGCRKTHPTLKEKKIITTSEDFQK